ncbi:hypothetical protein HYW30_00860, partial [Candidatus Azambacteria bacterium]|nr:hypothetical protein [Candidatus Azambacteria bacterium]
MTIHLPKSVRRTATKAFSASVSVMTILTLSGVGAVLPVMVAKAAIVDGDLIRASGDFDVYIVKLVGSKKLKRLILNPDIFNQYRHLKWSNVKTVTAAERDSYTTSRLVRADGDTKVYLLSPDGDTGSRQWITTGEYFVSQGYDWDAVYTVNNFERDSYTSGADVGPAAAPSPGVVGSLTVSLAADTPAAALVVQNAARVPFTKVLFTASGGDVTIDTMTIERTGPSADANFSDLVLIDVETNAQIGTEKTLSSEHKATFLEDITVKGGTTKAVNISGNMAGTLNGGELAALKLLSVVTKSNASVSGTPVTGNSMTMNSTLAIGTATVAAGGLVPAASTQRVGTVDYTLTSARITAGSAEDVEVQELKWFQNGTASDDDVANLDLYDAGTAVLYGTVAKPTAKYITFKFASPIVIKKGENKEFAIRGDIMSGSSRTVDWVIDKRIDLIVKGKTYGYFILPSYPNTTDPRFNPSDTTTIGAGTITVSKSAVTSLNIASGANQQELGRFSFNVTGEPISLTRLVFYATTSGSINITNLTSLTLYDSSGNVVAGPVDTTVVTSQTTQGRATTTDTVIVPVGTTNTYILKGNLTTSFTHNSTIQVGLISPNNQITARGQITNTTVTPSPSADTLADTVTVKAGALRVSLRTTPSAQNVIAGATDFTFAEVVLDASDSGEDVRVSTLRVKDTVGTADTQDDIINQKLLDGTTLLQTAQPTEGTATTTFTLTTPLVIPKGTTKTITHKASVVSSATAT